MYTTRSRYSMHHADDDNDDHVKHGCDGNDDDSDGGDGDIDVDNYGIECSDDACDAFAGIYLQTLFHFYRMESSATLTIWNNCKLK